jgi:hypothetical protein
MSVAALAAGGAPTRRQRSAKTVDAALRGGVLATIVATIAWILVTGVAATAFFFLIIATLVAAAWSVLRSSLNPTIWVALAAGWAVVLLERWAVQSHAGVWVAAAGYAGVIVGARRAGIQRRWLPLLAYPLISVAIVIAAGEDLLDPWGSSWLWIAAILGPVLGARTMLRPAEPTRP